ncbi:MAG: aspartyl protease family protein, partial [Vulcanimicrobiaceae bacterium]
TTSADAAYATGDFAAALSGYDDAIRQSPNDPEAHVGRARIALYANDLDTAQREAARALQLNPSDDAAQRLQMQIAARRDASVPAGLPPGSAEVTIPFIQLDPLPLVEVHADGVKAFFIIDTGAPNVVLDPGFARLLHVASTPGGTGTFAGGKTATVGAGTLQYFDIGAVSATNVPVSILPTRHFPGFGKRVDGIVGMGFLMHYTPTIDYGGKALILRARTPDVSASLASQASANGAVTVPFWLVGDHFVFARGHIGDAPESLLLVDTGLAGGGVMPTQATVDAAQLQLETNKATSGVGGAGTVQVVPLVVPLVSLGAFQRQNVPGFFDPQGSALAHFPFTVGGVVSHQFFEPGTLTYDFTSMRLYLTP